MVKKGFRYKIFIELSCNCCYSLPDTNASTYVDPIMTEFSKKRTAIILISTGIVFTAIQFIPPMLSHTNPPVTGEPRWNSLETRATFFKACADCHSNETVFPWYSSVAPVSWLVESDIREGRKHFNISEWDKRTMNGAESANEVRRGAMPAGLYLLMHSDANLNTVEKKKFIKGLIETFGDSKNKQHEIKFE